jgi:DNA repair protein RadC
MVLHVVVAEPPASRFSAGLSAHGAMEALMSALSFPYTVTSQYAQEIEHTSGRSRARNCAMDPEDAPCELRELTYCYRTKLDADGRAVRTARTLRGTNATNATVAAIRSLLEHEAVEVFGVLCLTTARTVICWHEVCRGGLDFASFRLREVFKPAIMANAAALIAAHNHPSGNPTPSAPDFDLTQQLVDAGRLLGIAVLDHIIVGHLRYVSLRRTWPLLFCQE